MSGRMRLMCVFAIIAAGFVNAASGKSDKPRAKRDDLRPTSWTRVSRSEASSPQAAPKSAPTAEKDKPGLSSGSESDTPQEPARTRKPVVKPTAAPGVEKDKPAVSPSSDGRSVIRPETGTTGDPGQTRKPALKPAPAREPLPVPVPFIESYRDTRGSSGGPGGDHGRGDHGRGRGGDRGDHRRGGGHGHGGDHHWHGWNPDYTWHGDHDRWRHHHYHDHGSWLFLWFHGPTIYFAPHYAPHVIRIPHDRVGVYVRQTGDDRLGSRFADAVREELRSEGVRVVYSDDDAALELYLVSMDENPEDPGWGSAVSVSYIWNPGNRFITAQMVDVGQEQMYDLANSVAGYASDLVDQYR